MKAGVKTKTLIRKYYIPVTIFILVITGYTWVRISTVTYPAGHNCRIWGIVFGGTTQPIEGVIRTHLDSLQKLSNNNPDGWGMAYFVVPDSNALLPVIERGEPGASLDPRYHDGVDHMTDFMHQCGIAHIRSGTSGPTSGIPDPHPFFRKSLHRDFSMFFAHNGTIPVDVLLTLIEHTYPGYLELNPPDYAPNYLDSDLYALYIMAVIDQNPELSITDCIKNAIISLDSTLYLQSMQGNFVMSDGNRLWALRFSKAAIKASYTLYYYPMKIGLSNFWVAASEPLDPVSMYWGLVPDSTLMVFTPNELPEFIRIFDIVPESQYSVQEGYRFIYPNPFSRKTRISFQVANYRTDNIIITLDFFDITGRKVKTIIPFWLHGSNPITVEWDGTNDQGKTLPAGVYFCTLKIGEKEYIKELILVR